MRSRDYQRIIHFLEENVMATIADLTASVSALQENLSTALTDLGDKITGLETQVDPALLDPLKASVDAMAAQVLAADPGPSTPAASAPTPAGPALFTFSGDAATIDAGAWPKADVLTSDGQPLFTFSGPTVPDPLPDGWALYTGPTVPVAPAA